MRSAGDRLRARRGWSMEQADARPSWHGQPCQRLLPAGCHSPIAAPGNLLKDVPGRTDWGARGKESQGTQEKGSGGGSLRDGVRTLIGLWAAGLMATGWCFAP